MMERINSLREELQERLTALQDALKKTDIRASIINQINDIVRPIVQDTASSDAVQNSLSRLSEFTQNVLTPMLNNYVSHDAAESLSRSVTDLIITVNKYQGPAKTGTLVKRKKVMKGCIFNVKADEAVALSSSVTQPQLKKSTDVLIKVAAVGLNHGDHAKAEKHIPLINNINGKLVGTEFSGIIENLGWLKGDHVHMFPFAIGDKVFGVTDGAMGEYISCSVSDIFWAPHQMPYEIAAALPVCGTAAYRSLKDNGMSAGCNVAVIGAAGALGNLVVQIAASMGAQSVIGIASAEHEEAVSSIGATTFIDYKNDNIQDVIEDNILDIVVDCYSKPDSEEKYEDQMKSKLKTTGKYVTLNANTIDQARKFVSDKIGYNVQRSGFDAQMGKVNRNDLALLASWWEEGKINPLVDRVYELNEEAVRDAFRSLKGGHCQGKVVVRVRDMKY